MYKMSFLIAACLTGCTTTYHQRIINFAQDREDAREMADTLCEIAGGDEPNAALTAAKTLYAIDRPCLVDNP